MTARSPRMDLTQTRNWNWRQTFRLGDQCKENAQKGTDAECRGNAPAESKDRRRGRVKQGRMPNREVFDAETGRDLVVYDAVGDCGEGAEQNDLRFLPANECSTCLRIVSRLGFFHGRAAMGLVDDWAKPQQQPPAFTKNFQLFYLQPRGRASGRQILRFPVVGRNSSDRFAVRRISSEPALHPLPRSHGLLLLGRRLRSTPLTPSLPPLEIVTVMLASKPLQSFNDCSRCASPLSLKCRLGGWVTVVAIAWYIVIHHADLSGGPCSPNQT